MALPRLPTHVNTLSSPSEPQKISITICGDGGCGKSSITLRLVRSQWTHEYDPTIEDSYSITRRIDGQTYHLSLTDTAGQEEYRGMWATSNLRSDAFLMVYDITNKESLGQLEEFNGLIDIEWETREEAWLRDKGAHPKKKGGTKREEEIPVKPVKIVAGNKCDLQQSRQVPAREGLDWARKHGCGFMETSARNTVNIEETFALIVRRVVEARRRAAVGESSQSFGETASNPSNSMHGSANGSISEDSIFSPAATLDRMAGVGATNGTSSRKGSIAARRANSPTLERLAQQSNMPGLAGRRNTTLSLSQNSTAGGTRRAVTAPLTPLPNVPEEEMGFAAYDEKGEGRGGKGEKIKDWFRRVFCWR